MFIVGNGFDLHHKIPSSYHEFGSYLRRIDPSTWKTVSEYLNFDANFWAYFEERLASFDEDAVIGYAEQFMGSYGADDWSDASHHDFEYEIEQIVDALSRKLHDHFDAWIKQLPPPVPGSYMPVRCINRRASYLTFNYTPTLETIYDVPRNNILHIHGNCAVSDDQLLLGHGWERLNEEKLSSKIDEDTDTRLAGGYQLIDRYFADTFKPTHSILERNVAFFSSITDVNEVIVLGHSLSDVDAPYLCEVIRCIRPSANWTVSCHRSPELEIKRMRKLGVAPAQSRFFPLSQF
nr:bacteriophage abortive infection AbiH family protein [Gluconacetobacter sacchari]